MVPGGVVYGVPAFPTAPCLGSHHENSRSCAGALWRGRRGFCRRGGGSLPGRYPLGPVYGRMPAEAWSGQHPGPAFPGVYTRPVRGGGEVYRVAFPLVCALSRILPREPPLLRGSPVEGPVWFFLPGRGSPPRAPPRVISPRSGAWDDANEGRVLGRHPWQAFPGISRLLPPPTGRGRSAGGAGGGGERGEQCMECRRIMSGIIFPGFAPFPGSYHENLRSCAGALWEGRRGSLCRGGGSLPGPSPGDIPTVRCMG